LDIASQNNISIQLSAIEVGATDGGIIHLHGLGVPTIVIGVAARHIHSDSSIIHRQDYDDAVKLLIALISQLDAKTVASFTE
jgi:putative aminopeptidase FrvX